MRLARHRPAPHTPPVGQLLDEQQTVAGLRGSVAARPRRGGQTISPGVRDLAAQGFRAGRQRA
ncbi:hypothetical protein ACIRPU_31960 [Streptomyces sp. NPDC102259]|uniref:hypothetical protein n=1 Tax=Streptomyces sp. NPDC102259 TaxID=3366148 RepID=UPI0037FAB870